MAILRPSCSRVCGATLVMAAACGEDLSSASMDAGGRAPAEDAATSSDAALPTRDANTPAADAGSDGGQAPPEGDASSQADAGGKPPTTICAEADEGQAARLTCGSGEIIAEIIFAGYGTPTGSCGGFGVGACDAANARATVSDLCIGRSSCTVSASNTVFGDPCSSTVKRLAIEARCEPGKPAEDPQPFKGVADSPCAARRALNVSWYYNWMQAENQACSDGTGGKFVPMIWGHTGAEQDAVKIQASVASFVARGDEYVLGFNEPDNATQSNLSVSTALTLWSSFQNPAIKVASPAAQANTSGQAWTNDFMTQLNVRTDLRADVLALHWYGWNAGSCDAAAAQLENYIKWAEAIAGTRPIWLTEWGCLNQSAPDEDTVVKFFQGALAVFDRHPRVQRYAWYPWATNCGLVSADGSLTALGQVYAAAPATR